MTTPIPEELEDYRRRIDALDREIIDLLARRFEVVRAVGELKTREGLNIVQSARVEVVIDRVMKMAADKGLEPDFVRRLYEMMIGHAHDLEREIARSRNMET